MLALRAVTTNKPKANSIFFTMLLCLLPILALNLGYHLIIKISEEQISQKRKEAAELELQSIAYSADFEFQFNKYSNNFSNIVKKVPTDLKNDKTIEKYFASEAKKAFAPPFPEHELFVFKIASGTDKCELIYKKTRKKIIKQTQLCKSFNYLVNVNKTGNSSINSSFLTKLTNSIADVKAYGQDNRGIPTYSLYEFESNRFTWNYYELDNNDIYGFYLFCKNNKEYENNAKRIVLEERKKENKKLNNSNYIKNSIRAFLPIFENGEKKIYQSNFLKEYKAYQDWEKNQIFPINSKSIEEFETSEIDNDFEIGKYKLYSFVGKRQDFLSVILVPINENKKTPDFLIITNILYSSFILLIILKGVLFGDWPELKLKHRFILNFLLASMLPLMLLSISSYAYLQYTKESSKSQYLRELTNCLKEFEKRKEQLWERYKEIINDTKNNAKLKSLLAKNKKASGQELEELILDIFNNQFDMPLKSVYLVDKETNGIVLQQAKPAKLNPKFNTNRKILETSKNINKYQYDTLIHPICRILSKDYNGKNIPFTTSEIGYNAIAGKNHPLHKDISNHRFEILITNTNNGLRDMRIYDFIEVDSENRYALLLTWSDEDLDYTAYNQTHISLSFKKPEFSFTAFKNELDGLNLINDNHKLRLIEKYNKKTSYNLTNEALSLSQNALLQKATITKNLDNIYIVAMPSQRFLNTALIGSCNMDAVENEIYYKNLLLIIVFIISALVVLICVYITIKIILDPISGLKKAVDKISDGNLNIRITGNSNDELGNLCNEFTIMTQGLRERQKLATLISDQAVEAINSGSLKTETFKGVALVSDIRNFTGTCEKYNPTLITELLNSHFAEMTAIISEQGGRIYKYIGDAIEAVFPEDEKYQEPACYRAYTAATRMIVKLHSINVKREHNDLFTYKIGVGLKYGEMYSGTIGSIETRLDYAIFGDPLKIAAKLEALSIKNPDYPIVIDKFIKEKLNDYGLLFSDISSDNLEAFTLDMVGTGSQKDNSETKTNNSVKLREKKPKPKNKAKHKIIESIFAGSEFNFISAKNIYIMVYLFIIITTISITLIYKQITETQINFYSEQASEKNLRLIEQIKLKESSAWMAFENLCRKISLKIENIISINENDKNKIEKELNTYAKELKEKHNFDLNIKSRKKEKPKAEEKEKKYEYSVNINGKTYAISCNAEYIKSNLKNFISGFADPEENIYIAMKAIDNSQNKWHYSENFDKELLTTSSKKASQYVINKSDENKGDVIFNGNKYSLIVANRIPERFNHNFNIYLIIISVFITIMTYYIYKTYNGNALVNSSIRAKLWVSLISIAIVPIVAVIITYSLYSIELEKLQKQDSISKLEKTCQTFEIKSTISLNSGLNYLNKISFSKELKTEIDKYITAQAHKDKKTLSKQEKNIRSLIKGDEKYAKEHPEPSFGNYEIMNFNHDCSRLELKEVVVTGKDWFITANNDSSFAYMYAEIGKSLANLQGNTKTATDKNSVKEIANGTKLEEGFQALRSLFGSKIYFQISNDIGTPIFLSVGDVIICILTHIIPDIKNPDFVILWICNKLPHNDLKAITNSWNAINNDIKPYKVYSTRRFDYEKMFFLSNEELNFKNHILKLSSYISNSLIPINGNIEINNKTYDYYAQACNDAQNSQIISIMDTTSTIEANKQTDKDVFTSIAIAVLLIIIITHNVAKDILEPIKSLMLGVKEANLGHYGFRINSNNKDELGVLCLSFDKMMKGLEEKHLMGKMVSKTAQAVSLSDDSETSRKADCVLLYILVKNFDKLSKSISAINLINELRVQVEHIAKAVLEEGGEIDKIMGEKQLIAFHTFNKPLKECINSACKVALKISKIESSGILPFNVALGISYGSVVTGFLGVGSKRDFTVIGDPVNVSARIATFAEKQQDNRFLISESVKEIAEEAFNTNFVGEVSLKGKSQPMKVFNIDKQIIIN